MSLSGEDLEEMECCRYMGEDMVVDGTIGAEASHKGGGGEGIKVVGALGSVRKESSVSSREDMGMFNGIIVLTVAWMQIMGLACKGKEQGECASNKMHKDEMWCEAA